MPELLIDGEPPTVGDLTHQALFNYGAYTSFAVEVGGVRGLDLHLARLEASSVELFGEPVGEARLRELMRFAIGGRDACWLRTSLFSPHVWMRNASWRGVPKVMTVTSPTPSPLATSLRVQVQTYRREAAHLKHVATFGLMRARRAAVESGFADALFVDEQGLVSEGSVWNIGFIRGNEVTWPQAPMLAGVAQALVDRGLPSMGLTSRTAPVKLADLGGFEAAFACNSATPACPIVSIDDHAFQSADGLTERLAAAWASNPPMPV